jgi:hypothetical protein
MVKKITIPNFTDDEIVTIVANENPDVLAQALGLKKKSDIRKETQ